MDFFLYLIHIIYGGRKNVKENDLLIFDCIMKIFKKNQIYIKLFTKNLMFLNYLIFILIG